MLSWTERLLLEQDSIHQAIAANTKAVQMVAMGNLAVELLKILLLILCVVYLMKLSNRWGC